jgi:hypothetical protein
MEHLHFRAVETLFASSSESGTLYTEEEMQSTNPEWRYKTQLPDIPLSKIHFRPFEPRIPPVPTSPSMNTRRSVKRPAPSSPTPIAKRSLLKEVSSPRKKSTKDVDYSFLMSLDTTETTPQPLPDALYIAPTTPMLSTGTSSVADTKRCPGKTLLERSGSYRIMSLIELYLYRLAWMVCQSDPKSLILEHVFLECLQLIPPDLIQTRALEHARAYTNMCYLHMCVYIALCRLGTGYTLRNYDRHLIVASKPFVETFEDPNPLSERDLRSCLREHSLLDKTQFCKELQNVIFTAPDSKHDQAFKLLKRHVEVHLPPAYIQFKLSLDILRYIWIEYNPFCVPAGTCANKLLFLVMERLVFCAYASGWYTRRSEQHVSFKCMKRYCTDFWTVPLLVFNVVLAHLHEHYPTLIHGLTVAQMDRKMCMQEEHLRIEFANHVPMSSIKGYLRNELFASFKRLSIHIGETSFLRYISAPSKLVSDGHIAAEMLENAKSLCPTLDVDLQLTDTSFLRLFFAQAHTLVTLPSALTQLMVHATKKPTFLSEFAMFVRMSVSEITQYVYSYTL